MIDSTGHKVIDLVAKFIVWRGSLESCAICTILQDYGNNWKTDLFILIFYFVCRVEFLANHYSELWLTAGRKCGLQHVAAFCNSGCSTIPQFFVLPLSVILVININIYFFYTFVNLHWGGWRKCMKPIDGMSIPLTTGFSFGV